MKPTLLVLAAGMGTRFGGDKQTSSVGPNGEYVLDYSIRDAWRAGFGSVVLVIRPALEASLREHFGHKWDGKLDIQYVVQDIHDLPAGYTCPETRQKPWGTGHAIWCARKAVKGPFAAINADDFYGARTFQVLGEFLAGEECRDDYWAMVGFVLNKTLSENGTVARGICHTDANGELKTVVETTDIGAKEDGVIRGIDSTNGKDVVLNGTELVSMNFWGFSPALFGHLEEALKAFLAEHINEAKSECYIPFVVDALIRRGAVKVKMLETPERWFGMTYMADRQVVVDHLKTLD